MDREKLTVTHFLRAQRAQAFRGLRVQGFRFRVSGYGLRSLGFRAPSLGPRGHGCAAFRFSSAQSFGFCGGRHLRACGCQGFCGLGALKPFGLRAAEVLGIWGFIVSRA